MAAALSQAKPARRRAAAAVRQRVRQDAVARTAQDLPVAPVTPARLGTARPARAERRAAQATGAALEARARAAPLAPAGRPLGASRRVRPAKPVYDPRPKVR